MLSICWIPVGVSELVRLFAQMRRFNSKHLKPLDAIGVHYWTLKMCTLGGLDGAGSRIRMIRLCSSLSVY